MSDTLYDTDFYAWTQQQAAALRRIAEQRPNLPVDWMNLAEEIESVGKSDRREIANRLAVLLLHLLKLRHSPDLLPRAGWEDTAYEQRLQIMSVIADSPSLQRIPSEALPNAYRIARRKAASDLKVDQRALPAECPFDLDREILDELWVPEPSVDPEAR